MPVTRPLTTAVAALTIAVGGFTAACSSTPTATPPNSTATPTTSSTALTPLAAPTSIAPTSIAPSIAPTLAPIPSAVAAPPVTPVAAPAPRPANGAQILRTGRRGSGTLEIRNGTDRDGAVTLARDGRALVGIYVRAGSSTTLRGIADGTYDLFFRTGTGWDAGRRTFLADAQTQRFDQPFEYTTTRRATTVWSISLDPEVGGTAATSSADDDTSPR